MNRFIGRLGVAAIATAATGLAIPISSAVAAPSTALANDTSTTFAGYGIVSAPASAKATDTFKVPTLACTKTSGIAIGAFVVTTTGASGAGVWAQCSGKTPALFGILVINSVQTQTAFTPKAGDTVTINVSESASSAKATINDVTQKKTKTLPSSTGGKNSEVLLGTIALDNASGVQLPVPKFSPISLTAGGIDGKTVKAAQAVPVNMVTSGETLQIQTGALNSGGNAWTETFKHS